MVFSMRGAAPTAWQLFQRLLNHDVQFYQEERGQTAEDIKDCMGAGCNTVRLAGTAS